MSQVWLKAAALDGLHFTPPVAWHSLRHTHATLLHAQGASQKTIQAQLRHATARVTQERYTHVTLDHQRREVKKLERRLIGPKRTQVQESERVATPLIQ